MNPADPDQFVAAFNCLYYWWYMNKKLQYRFQCRRAARALRQALEKK